MKKTETKGPKQMKEHRLLTWQRIQSTLNSGVKSVVTCIASLCLGQLEEEEEERRLTKLTAKGLSSIHRHPLHSSCQLSFSSKFTTNKSQKKKKTFRLTGRLVRVVDQKH